MKSKGTANDREITICVWICRVCSGMEFDIGGKNYKMEKMQKKYIKYMGDMRALDEVINVGGLSKEEVLQSLAKFYEQSSKRVTKDRTRFYQEKLKVTPRAVKIEKISNRWGSCNSRKEITYNYLISTLPMELIDYIVVHELCHIHHMNHDRSFWRKVGSIIPDYKQRKSRLEESRM